MSLRTIQDVAYAAGPGPVSYYLNQLEFKNDIDILGYQDIAGSYYFKSLGLDKVIQLLKSKKSNYLIYVACDHPSDETHSIEKKLKNSLPDTRILTITGTGNYSNLSEPDILYFPYYWYAFLPGAQKFYMPWSLDSSNFILPRQYSVSCLNNLCRFHRIKLLDRFFYRPYFQKILYSFNSKEADDYFDDPEMQRLTQKYSRFLPLKLDRKNSEYGDDMLSLNHPGLYDSYLNIATGNHYNVAFVDEKIFKPIAAGQFFVTLSGPGTIQTVRNLGFDTFDDIIDHSYDNESDLDIRIGKLVSSVDKWMQLNHEKIWNETYHRRLSNAEHFFNLDVNRNPFRDFLSDL